MILKFINLSLLICLIAASDTCAPQCLTCQQYNNPYSCLSCSPNNQNIYILSCPNTSQDAIPFIIVAAIITILHLFMLSMGIGIYRDLFQNIQLATLITWRYNFEQGTVGLQLTNLGIVRNNSFPDTFGGQFIFVMIILGVYWILLIGFYRSKTNSMAILLKRKVIILPTRIITFVFNILLYASMIQVTTLNTQAKIKLFAFILAILALVKIGVVVIGLAVTCNWKRFQVSDPHYYVLVEQITTKKWYAKNNVLFSLLVRATIIISFVTLFQQPLTAGVIMLAAQFFYTLYILSLIRYQNIRYFIFIITGNIFMISLILVIYLSNIYTLQSSQWQTLSLIYRILLILFVVIFFVATMLELVIKKDMITKQLKSFYFRFVRCQKLQNQVEMNKYDEGSGRQKVKQFYGNSLYQKSVPENNVELIISHNSSNQ